MEEGVHVVRPLFLHLAIALGHFASPGTIALPASTPSKQQMGSINGLS
jgi:hypothetical protein